uniref:Cysteine proteinase inhibitor n=1 Tax=Adiantum reniforme var. sinense TaxID=269174 RepID=A0A6C0W0P0_9MONI|nr:putative REF2 [Adiantum reniforme var. sinense]
MAVLFNQFAYSTVFLSALLFISFTITPAMSLPGGLQEMPTAQNDLEVQDLGKFAVDEHNSRQNSDLEYAGIVSAHKKVVAGLMYHLKLRASSGGNVNVYEAKVWIKPWEKFKSLEHFERVESSLSPADLGTHLDDSEALGLRPISSDDPAVKEAAKEALKSVQARSNSLVPYELKEVVSAHAEVSDEHTKFNILFKVHRGTKEEQFKAEVLRTVVGDWTIKNLQQHN